MTTTYWRIGQRIVESEQRGNVRADYGAAILERLAGDLSKRFGRGFSRRNLQSMRLFYLSHPIWQTPSAKLISHKSSDSIAISQTVSAKLQSPRTVEKDGIWQTSSAKSLKPPFDAFPLPWSHYVRLLSVENAEARAFYEEEALRGGWSIRQLDRQINSLFYERTTLSRKKAAVLAKGRKRQPEDVLSPEEQIKDSFVLEFLGLKDEYSESDLEEALIDHLQAFLLELGDDYAFIGRQRRLRIGGQWYRVDLLFFHRRLRSLLVIDLKVGPFTHADAGQMHLYLNYARERWLKEGENPPVGLILCAYKDKAVAHYALEGLSTRVLAAEYRLRLPTERQLVREIEKSERAFAIWHAVRH